MAAFELFNLTFYTTYVVIEAFLNRKSLETCYYRLDIFAILQFALYFSTILFILGIACFCQDHETLPVLILKSIAVFFSLLNFYGFFAYWVSLFKSPECLTKGLKIDLGITETVYFLIILFISIGLAIDHFEYESSCLSL